jgi:aryl-alcohol dehydrogenase-like predicted oxidoreductase
MDYRPLGRTGVSASNLCLGAMMFGAAGNADHDDAVRIIHRALDAGINFIDTADAYSAGESELIVGKALAGGRREHVVLATKFGMALGEDINHRELPGGDHRCGRRLAETALDRLDRPLPAARHRSDHRSRRDPQRAVRPGACGQDPCV